MDHSRLIALLRQSKDVDGVVLGMAIMEYERWGNDIVRCLLDKRAIPEDRLLHILSQVWGVPSVDLTTYRPTQALVDTLSVEVADTRRAIPFAMESSFLSVAFASPTAEAIDAVRVHTKMNIRPHVALPRDIDRCLSQHYGRMNIGGYVVDPRVTSENFLSADMDLDVGEASMSIPVDLSSFDGVPAVEAAKGEGQQALEARVSILSDTVTRLEQRIALMEAHVARDEDVLRRLFGFIIDKGVGTRDEVAALLGSVRRPS